MHANMVPLSLNRFPFYGFRIHKGSGLLDPIFAQRLFILVMVSALVTSQGDFTTTQRIANGFSGIVGIDQKTQWKYLSIILWKASEFIIGWLLDCTGIVNLKPSIIDSC